MIYFIKGTLVGKFETTIVVETGGIGYEVTVPGNSGLYQKMEGEEIICYTSMIVREDDVSLYGFEDKESLDMFKLLITVSGVGAKAAIAILSTLTVTSIKQAVAFGDDKMLATANGIGKKTAQRLVLELKDKIGNIEISNEPDSNHVNEESDNKSEAVNALVSLGYSKAEAINSLKGIQCESVEEYIKKALKNLF